MNKEDPYRDQAERLRQRIEKINDSSETKETLPPRGDLHRHVKKKTKWKLKFPIIRLLLITFFLLLITIYSAYSYLGGKKFGDLRKTSSHTSGYDTVNNIEKSNPDKNTAEKKSESDNTGEQADGINVNNASSKSDSGAVLVIPSTSEITGPETDKNISVEDKKEEGKNAPLQSHSEVIKFKFHKVGHQETLFHIAMTYYHSPLGVEWIKKANNISQDGIKEGQLLKIPIKK